MTKIIALDAGHGLNTAGKQTPDGIKEWTLNDKIRDKVVSLLKDYDVQIIHTDNNDGTTDERLSYRLNKYMKAGVALFVSIHHNALKSTWSEATGVEVYTDVNPTAEDVKLANLIYNKMVKYTGLKGRGVKQADFYVINQDKIPAILCEGGFMDGTNDYKVITSDKGQTAYARAVAEGIVEYLGLKKKTTAATTSKAFLIKVANIPANDPDGGLVVRKEPNSSSNKTGLIKYNDPKKYTIVETKVVSGQTWGKLKSGLGWINLYYTKRV